MMLKFFSWVCVLVFFASLAGMFVFIRHASPSWLSLFLYFIGVVGGGILGIWAGERKFPNRLIILALISGYLTFLILGLGRIAPITDRMGYLWLALMMGASTFAFAHFGLEKHEKRG